MLEKDANRGKAARGGGGLGPESGESYAFRLNFWRLTLRSLRQSFVQSSYN